MTFARKFVTGDPTDAPIYQHGTTTVLCAYGADNTFAFHTGGFVAQALQFVVPVVAPTAVLPSPTPSAPLPTATPIPAATPTPAPGAQNFQATLSDIASLQWSVSGDVVSFVYSVQGLRWIAFGVSAASGSNLMTGPPASDVVICKAGSSPAQYRTTDMVSAAPR